MVGITAYGAYVPRLRLQRAAVVAANAFLNPGLKGLAKGERAMANWDEDAVTMAVEAARDCLDGVDRGALGALALASTTLPFADRQNAGIVKEALNLSDGTATFDATGSLRAGTGALVQALAAVRGGAAPQLVVASEKRRPKPGSEAELTSGDGAAALLIGHDGVIAELIGTHSVSIDFVDHFRADDAAFDYGWESRWVRDEGYGRIVPASIKAALATFGLSGADIAHFVMPCTMKGVAEGLAKKAGMPDGCVRDTLAATLGDTGAAHALVMLAHTLERAAPGDVILVVNFAQGCDVLAFRVTDTITALPARRGVSGWLQRRKAEANYVKYLFFNGLVELDRGMRAEADQKPVLTGLYRNRKTVLGLVGGRCTRTGTVQFPRTRIGVNPNDHALDTQEDYPLADRPARILTYTADNLTYSPDPPAFYGMIQFDEGGRMMADFTDVDADQVEVGRPMRMMFRIKAVDEVRGFTKYFWKAVPA